MINRQIAPELKPLQAIRFVEPHTFDITPSVKLFWMQEVADETVRIEFHFDAGTIRSEEKLASFVNGLLLSGTATKSSTKIHEELDSLGAYIDQEIAQELAVVSLYCLRKNAEKAVEILINAIQEVAFDEQEVSDLLRERKQGHLVSLEKVNMLARRAFQQNLFAGNADYNRLLTTEDFDHISIPSMKRFHKEAYLQGLTKVVVVGNVSQQFIDRLIDAIGAWSQPKKGEFVSEIISNKGHIHIEKSDAVQTAIRMGIPLFNKTHADFTAFGVLQTVFGDYFGSRLMSNIREDKGYTYGIGCGISESQFAGYFIIATEVGKDVTEATLKEIRFEMERLHTELISEDELELVRNYMLGQILKSADGPNQMMDLYLNAQNHGLKFDYYNDAIEKIKQIDTKELQDLASSYLIWDNFTLITAGSTNE